MTIVKGWAENVCKQNSQPNIYSESLLEIGFPMQMFICIIPAVIDVSVNSINENYLLINNSLKTRFCRKRK